jgi:hypothetical protein
MANLNARMLDFLLRRIQYGTGMDGRCYLEMRIDVGPEVKAPGDAHSAICMLMAKDKKEK